MLRSFKTLAFAMAALMLAVPAASAWNSFGTFEPDTAYDVRDGYMWTDGPDNSAEKQVYFNAFFGSTDAFGATTVNPNVAAAQTGIEASGAQMAYALFGVWRDCNLDGYIGMAESAVLEYRSELLLDNTVCQPEKGTGPGFEKRTHNDGTWVTELLWISNPRTSSSSGEDSRPPAAPKDYRTFRDEDARVWGDVGLPGTETGGATCPISPFPRGTMQSTGGALDYVDCRSGFGEAWNSIFLGRDVTAAGQTVTVPGADESNSLGLAYADDDDMRQEGHPLHIGTFGNEDSSESMATLFDCESAPVFVHGEGQNQVRVYPPAPAVKDPNGSPAATVNETLESSPMDTTFNTGNCDTTDDQGNDLYGTLLNEGDHEGVDTSDKRQASWDFQYTDMARGGAPGIVLGATKPGQAPQNLGLSSMTLFGAYWSCNCILTGATPALPVRASIAEQTVTPGAAPDYFTFYGYTALTSELSLPGGGASGIYGDEWCEGGTDIVLGFNCDPTVWNMNGDGTEPAYRYLLAKAGDLYNVRDIDCYDTSVGGTIKTCLRAGDEIPAGA